MCIAGLSGTHSAARHGIAGQQWRDAGVQYLLLERALSLPLAEERALCLNKQ
jgi:hypothetical protein